jgi:hypothetical protein
MCNYTFEYDRAAREPGARGAVPLHGGILVVAAVAAVMAAALLVPSVRESGTQRPELGLVLIPIGLFSIAGSLFGWRWFFAARKASWITALFGITGARIVYAILGGFLVGAGIALVIA